MPAKPRWLLAIPDAIRQLDALAQALTNDYEQFEALVEAGEAAGGGGAGRQ